MFYQIPIQIILLLLASTDTPTTGGLESFFKKDSFLGINASPTSILTASVILSMTSAILRHVKALVAEKGFLTFKPKMTVFMWTLCAAVRRILTFVIFFAPSLGLFHLLHHWKAETYPFKFRINSVKRLNITPGPDSKIELFNMTETVYWSELDRWDYSDPQHPTAPSYKLYTGINLQETFAAFFVLLIVQCMSLLLVKMKTSEEFQSKGNYFEKLLHLLENVNFPVPYRDWDHGRHSVAEFRRRYSNTEREMIWSFVVTSLYTAVMITPLFYTGCYIYLPFTHWLIAIIVNSVYMINTRHQFLSRLIGTKPEEDLSLEAANHLATVVTLVTIAASMCEVAFFFLFNRIVSSHLEF